MTTATTSPEPHPPQALAERLETLARERPRTYKTRVAALALLGYGYLGLMLALLLGLLALSAVSVIHLKALGVKLLLLIAPFVWLVARALWVRPEAPTGLAITAADAPELFARIERLRMALSAPRFHRVLINEDFNASVSQVPRLGLFGWQRNYLVIGLPLLKTLTVEQFEAVLAHEFGHLAGGHAAFATWLYRLRLAWERLRHALETTQSAGTILFRRFFAWFVPRFSAYSFPLARANEYQADAVATRLASPRALAQALTAVNVFASYFSERFWPGIHAEARHRPEPAFAPFASLDQRLHDEIDPELCARWLDRALAARTSRADTHPALADRLRAIGGEPEMRLPEPGAGADRLLEPSRTELIQRLDQAWRDSIAADWGRHFEETRENHARLAELAARAAAEPLNIDDAIERARLEHSVGAGLDAAIAQYRDVLAAAPEHGLAHYLLGECLLERDDPSGLDHMGRALTLADDLCPHALDAMARFHARMGDTEAAERTQDRLAARLEEEHAAAIERSAVRRRDRFIASDIAADTRDALAQTLRALGVRQAWLVRKDCRHLPHRPLYVLGFRYTGRLRLYRAHKVDAALKRIAETVSFPGETLILHTEAGNTGVGRRLRRVADSRIL